MTKKILAIVLAVAMMLALVPAGSAAYRSDWEWDWWGIYTGNHADVDAEYFIGFEGGYISAFVGDFDSFDGEETETFEKDFYAVTLDDMIIAADEDDAETIYLEAKYSKLKSYYIAGKGFGKYFAFPVQAWEEIEVIDKEEYEELVEDGEDGKLVTICEKLIEKVIAGEDPYIVYDGVEYYSEGNANDWTVYTWVDYVAEGDVTVSGDLDLVKLDDECWYLVGEFAKGGAEYEATITRAIDKKKSESVDITFVYVDLDGVVAESDTSYKGAYLEVAEIGGAQADNYRVSFTNPTDAKKVGTLTVKIAAMTAADRHAILMDGADDEDLEAALADAWKANKVGFNTFGYPDGEYDFTAIVGFYAYANDGTLIPAGTILDVIDNDSAAEFNGEYNETLVTTEGIVTILDEDSIVYVATNADAIADFAYAAQGTNDSFTSATAPNAFILNEYMGSFSILFDNGEKYNKLDTKDQGVTVDVYFNNTQRTVSGISNYASEVTVVVGSKTKIEYDTDLNAMENGIAGWTSTNSKVAVEEGGKIVAKKVGECYFYGVDAAGNTQIFLVKVVAKEATPETPVAGDKTQYVVSTKVDPLNVRKGPATTYSVVGKLAIGEIVNGTPVEGTSWAIIYNADGTVKGYSSLKYLLEVVK